MKNEGPALVHSKLRSHDVKSKDPFLARPIVGSRNVESNGVVSTVI